jgi:hypothetical protein
MLREPWLSLAERNIRRAEGWTHKVLLEIKRSWVEEREQEQEQKRVA